MASYILVGSSSIVQILSPQVSEDVVAATIKTIPTGIVATTLVSQAAFDSGAAADDLTAFADAIEQIVAEGYVVGGSATSSLDASGLQQYYVTFEVGYNPPGAPTNTVTVDVNVPADYLTTTGESEGQMLIVKAEAMIVAAYNNLVALSGG